MRCIAFGCEAGFGSTDFSLYDFGFRTSGDSHGLKPVLLNHAGPALLANSIRPWQEVRVKHRPEVFIWNSIY